MREEDKEVRERGALLDAHEYVDKYIDYYKSLYLDVGDRGIMGLFLPSPIVTISATMSFENFLYMSIAEKEF